MSFGSGIHISCENEYSNAISQMLLSHCVHGSGLNDLDSRWNIHEKLHGVNGRSGWFMTIF